MSILINRESESFVGIMNLVEAIKTDVFFTLLNE